MGESGANTREMRTALTISAVSHAVILLWGVWAFAAKPHTAKSESLTVDVISAQDFSQLTAGSRNAPKVEAEKPLVDTIGERKTVDDPTGKVGKKDIADTTEKPPPAPPKPPTPEEKKPPEPKRDLIAEAIKKDQAKKAEPKRAEAKAPTPPKKDQPQFDPKKIQQALLDKREPQRAPAIGDTLSPAVPLGTAHGQAAQLSQSELDALRDRLASLWT